MAKELKAPSAARQVSFHQLLVAARRMWLMEGLSEALGKVDPKRLKRELSLYAPGEALKILAAAGVRDEHVFPTPVVLEEKPSLVGYYRLLLGVPQKSFYASGTGMGVLRGMETSGTMKEGQKARLAEFCRVMGQGLAELVQQISPKVTRSDVIELPILTLGAQLQGANNNKIGQQATRGVFLSIAEIVKSHIVEKESTQGKIVVRNASKRRVTITLASDPDVRVEVEGGPGIVHRQLALEIKGGTDKSNAHNRAGEADKSHQKAKKQGFTNFWTLIALQGIELSKLKDESPTTNVWFDVSHVLAREGSDWILFRESFAHVVGIPA